MLRLLKETKYQLHVRVRVRVRVEFMYGFVSGSCLGSCLVRVWVRVWFVSGSCLVRPVRVRFVSSCLVRVRFGLGSYLVRIYFVLVGIGSYMIRI